MSEIAEYNEYLPKGGDTKKDLLDLKGDISKNNYPEVILDKFADPLNAKTDLDKDVLLQKLETMTKEEIETMMKDLESMDIYDFMKKYFPDQSD